MKVLKKILLFVVVMSGFGCTAIRLSDTMKTADFATMKSKKMLVVSKSDEVDVTENYEKEIASRLRTMGIDAIERHVKYPQLVDDNKPTPEEMVQIIEMLKKDGISGVIVTSLKETRERVEIINEGGDYYPTSTSYGKYNLTFNPDYTESYMKYDGANTGETTVLTSTIYFLEAISYDLSLEKQKQLTSISLVEVKDPNSALKVRKKFSKIIVKQFE